MRPVVKYLLLAAVGGTAALFVAVLVGYRWIRSPAGSLFVLSQAKRTLASSGVALEYGRGTVDPFAVVHFDNLKIVRGKGDERMELTAKSVDLRYRIAFFRRAIDIQTLRIVDPKIVLRSRSTGAAEEKKVPAAGGGLEAARDFFRSPPVRVNLPEAVLENLVLDVVLETPDSRTEARARVGAKAKLVTESGHVRLSLEGQLMEPGFVRLTSRSGDTTTTVEAFPTAGLSGEVEVRRDGARWSHDVRKTQMRVASSRVTLVRDGKAPRRIALTRPSFTLGATGSAVAPEPLTLDADAFKSLDVRSTLTLADGTLTDGATNKTSVVEAPELVFSGQLEQDIALRGRLVLKSLRSPDLSKAVPADAELSVRLPRSLASFDATVGAKLDGIPLLDGKIDGHTGNALSVKGTLASAPDARLARVVKAAAPLARLGTVHVKAILDGELKTKLAHLAALDAAAAEAPVAGKIAIEVAGTGKAAEGILAPVRLDADVRYEKKHLAVDGALKRRGAEVGRFKAGLEPKDELQSGTLEIDAIVGEPLEGLLTKGQLEDYGHWKAKLATTFQLRAPPAGKSFAREGKLVTSGTAELTPVRRPELSGKLRMRSPVKLGHRITLDRGKLVADVEGSADTLVVEELGEATGSKLALSVRAPNLSGGDVDFTGQVRQERFTFAKEIARETPSFPGLALDLKGSLHGDRFSLDALTADFGKALIRLTADAGGRVKRQDFQLNGRLVAELPADFPRVGGHKLVGRFDLPWTLSVLRGRELNLEGDLELKNVSWAMGTRRVAGINGKVPVSEKLIRKGAGVRFAYLITQNPFERVDFERLRPLISRADQVRIDEVGFEEKKYGPFVGFFSLRQNMVFAHQFDMSLGGRGLAYGEMYFDVYPANLQLGFLSRLTAIDLTEVLPKKFLPKLPKGEKTVSARSGLVVNLNRATVDGRIDITEISASQLVTLINALDPKYEDDKMNNVRTALAIGYPTFVSMAMQRGYLDMGIDVTALGISTHFDVRGVPISTFVAAATSGIVKRTQEGPLK